MRNTNIDYSKVFAAGFVAGAGVFGAEFSFFIISEVFYKTTEVLPSNHASDSIISFFSIATLVISLVGLVTNFLLGLLNSETFTIGFLIGDGFMTVILADAMLDVAPSVLSGMIIAFIIVLIGFLLRLFKNTPQNSQWNY